MLRCDAAQGEVGRRVLYQWTQAAVSCVGFQSGWFPSNVARNSRAHISDIEMWSLELQRLWPISKNDRVKLRATFAGVVTVVTFRSHYSPGVVPGDPGGGFAFDLAPIAPRGRPHLGDPPRDHTNRRYKLTNPHPHHGTPASTDQRYQHHHPSHQQWTHPGHPHAPPHSYAAAPHPSSYHGPSTQTQPRQQHHAQNQQHHDHP